jgi:dienelactone hydrolase
MRALLLLLFCSGAPAQGVSGGEKVEFPAGAEKIFGYLYRPAAAAPGRHPAIIIVHGSGGVREVREGFWARELSGMGLVALVTDSFTPRGVDSTVEDQSRVTTFQMVRDAFAALAFLSQQDFVDGKRVAVMGMSKGGSVALLAADQQAVQRAGRAFAAHLPLYPSCTLQYRNPRPTAPLLMLIGERDNYTGLKLCAAYAERLRAAGGQARIKTYPGAHHAFDGDPAAEREFFLARAENYSDCVILIEEDGKLAPFDKSCIRRGATVASSHRAKMQALEDVKSFVKTTLLN